MEKELISIVMVNFNNEHYIKKAIESVIAQTYENWELIIVDDGSTDNSVEVVNQYAEKDSRIKIYPQEKNSQICVVTNIGFEHVKGEFVARLDSDDIWKADKLEKQMKYMREHPEGALCFTKLNIINDQGEIVNSKMDMLYKLYNERRKDRKEWIRFFFFNGNTLIQSTLLMRRAVLDDTGGFNLAYMQGHDFDFFVRAVRKYEFLFIEEPLVEYRRTEKQNSSLGAESNRRFFNEHMSIRYHYFDHMTDELFREMFKEDFVNEDASSHEELLCEQAFLLCRCINGKDVNPILGFLKLEELMHDEQMVKVLKEKYNFTPKDLYNISGKRLFFSEEMLEEKRELTWTIAQLEHERDHLKECQDKQYWQMEQLKKEKEEMQGILQRQKQHIEAMESSMSWKLTKGMRKVGSCIKRNAHK